MTPAQTVVFAFSYVILGTLALGGMSAAPWVRTRKRLREFIASQVDFKDGDVVYDLGCGDGAVLFSIADKRPGVRSVGYEIALLPYAIGLISKALGGKAYRNVSIRCRDFFGMNLADADGVFVFLLEESYPRVVKKLAKELRDDAQVVVAAWPFPGIAAERTERAASDVLPVYFYRGAALRAASTSGRD
ncbi:MAG: hypothetical protein RL272_283 [Candidatus Parcubacteria bacterium]|jgi:predicted RNA methylase